MAAVTTGTTPANGIELAYETFGDPAQPTVLLIMGLGAQMITWPEEFCRDLVDRGFHVVRFDNRDAGHSTWLPTPGLDIAASLMGLLAGQQVEVPYLLTDLADDAAALLGALGIESAHVVGASMGGMIAQTLAIHHPDRVRSLTSIMSTTGEPHVGQAEPEVLTKLLSPRPTDREDAIASTVEMMRMISAPDHFDEVDARKKIADEYDRAFNPEGTARQLLAIAASGSREAGLAALDLPTLVVHGHQDTLITVSGGTRTAELIPGAELLLIDDMGHDVPLAHHQRITDAIAALARRADEVAA